MELLASCHKMVTGASFAINYSKWRLQVLVQLGWWDQDLHRPLLITWTTGQKNHLYTTTRVPRCLLQRLHYKYWSHPPLVALAHCAYELY